jgi:hypothetical protein
MPVRLQHAGARLHADDPAAQAQQAADLGVQQEARAALAQDALESQAERIAVAGVLARRVDPAREARPHRRERRLERDARVGVEGLLLRAEARLVVDEAPCRLERHAIRMHDELAVPAVDELDPLLGDDPVHERAARTRAAATGAW